MTTLLVKIRNEVNSGRLGALLSHGVSTDLENAKTVAFWFATTATIIMALVVGFFLHGGLHGQYMDDYFIKTWAFNFSNMQWKLTLIPHPPRDPISLRPLVYLFTPNLANLLPDHELPLRFGIVIVHLLNALLLAKLAERLTKSRFVGLVAGAWFLFPVIANEGLLWVTAAIADTLSLLLLLIGFHLLLSCRFLREDLPLLIFGVATWLLGIMFYEPGILTLFLLPFCFGMVQPEQPHVNKPWLVAIVGAYLPLALYAVYVGKNSQVIAQRGGITLNPGFIIHKIPDVTRNVVWLVTNFGILGPIRGALKVGWHEWSASIGGIALLSGLILGLCAVSALFSTEDELGRYQKTAGNIKLALIGLTWMVMGLLPVLIVRSQIVEIRALYTPFAGLALCLAALSGLIADAFGRWRAVAIRIILVATSAAIFSSSLAMAGLERAYELRWQLDEKQTAAVQPVLNSVSRTQPLWLLPVALDETILDRSEGKESLLNGYLFGVFEHSATAQDALRLKFGDRDIHVVAAQHWDRLHVTSVRRSDGGRVTNLVVQGVAIPIEHLVAFTYREGEVILLDPIEIDNSDPNVLGVVDLPLVHELVGTSLKLEKVQFQLEHQD